MSEFVCEVVRVAIEPHPNADAIELARVGDYISIVKKGQFVTGDLAVYIPEQAVLPEWMLKKLGFWDDLNNKGTLTSAAGNRVRAVKLRGVFSQGLLYPVETRHEQFCGVLNILAGDQEHQTAVELGEDAAEWLGITKWEPAVPIHMQGKMLPACYDAVHGYDFENIKKRPDLFQEGELVVITEKIHGTLLQVSVVPESMANERYYKGRVIITSKGLGREGFILDHTDETNLYAQVAKKYDLLEKMLQLYETSGEQVIGGLPMVLFGEVYGVGVQDLSYAGDRSFRAFDMTIGVREKANFYPFYIFKQLCDAFRIDTVPVLYAGEFSREKMLEVTNGKETVSGTAANIREGVVVKSATETKHPVYGRKIAKSISEAYLMRKGNTTEFN